MIIIRLPRKDRSRQLIYPNKETRQEETKAYPAKHYRIKKTNQYYWRQKREEQLKPLKTEERRIIKTQTTEEGRKKNNQITEERRRKKNQTTISEEIILN